MNPLCQLIPLPRSLSFAEGVIAWKSVRTVSVPAELLPRIKKLFAFFGENITAVSESDAVVSFVHDPELAKNAFRIQITPEKISVSASDNTGFLYASGALGQLMFTSYANGDPQPVCPCGTIEDAPEFGWRGFMLDTVRHFIRKEIMLDVIRILSGFRINVLHLHLTDGNAWRPALACLPAGVVSEQHYTPDDLREIAAYAKQRGIMIVPEIEMPGHNEYITSKIPELGCEDSHGSSELCLSSPFVRKFLENVLTEIAAIFPESTHLHLGGDEANTKRWESCPDCQKVCAERGISVRQLEHEFMTDMCHFVQEKLHRTPICWSSNAEPPEDAVMQVWRCWDDIASARSAHKLMINSLLQNYYFDYPENQNVVHADYAPLLDEESVYISSPYHSARVEPDIQGVEACLWSERIPDWRLYSKIMSRIAGYSEVAWTPHPQRKWNEFLSRKQTLEASSWMEQILRGTI